MEGVLLLLLLMAPFAVVVAVARNRRVVRSHRAATSEVRSDDDGVWRELADGRREGVSWHEVREVAVLRTDRGPHGRAGGALVLYGDETRGCLVPLDRLGESGVVVGLTRLAGFDASRLARAVEDRPGTYEIWVHPEGGFGVEA